MQIYIIEIEIQEPKPKQEQKKSRIGSKWDMSMSDIGVCIKRVINMVNTSLFGL